MKKLFLLQVQAAIFTTFLLVNNSNAQPVLGFTPIVSGLSSPVDISSTGDGTNRLFIVQQTGQIRILSSGALLPASFLDITPLLTTGGERGLLSIAFHPDYETNRYFFVYYTNLNGDITIARYQADAVNPNQTDPLSGVVLINIPKPFGNHNGGDLNFGPDGYLYFATGDGGSGGDPNNLAQNGNSLLGKMIRIDVNNFSTPPYYTIPPDNPYVNNPLVDDHIWAIGLRNPWRWSFDRLTNDMWIADVGQGAWEEVNYRAAGTNGGVNYGWRCYEGNAAYNTAGCLPQSSYVSPVFEYPHVFTTGGFSITGGFVYRGPEYSVLQGKYICADYVSGNVWMVYPNGSGGWTSARQGGLPGNISSFGEAENGALYAVSLGGTVFKVDVTAVLPVTLISFTGNTKEGYNELLWTTTAEQNMRRFIVEFSIDGRNFQTAGDITALNMPGENNYVFRHIINESRKIFYRLRLIDGNGSDRFSTVITIAGNDVNTVKVFPTVIGDNIVRLISNGPLSAMYLFDSRGALVMHKQLNRQSGFFTVHTPALAAGIYWLRVHGENNTEIIRLVFQ